jgi:hypothetical protein
VGIHWLGQAGQWPMVLDLTEEHQHWLHLVTNQINFEATGNRLSIPPQCGDGRGMFATGQGGLKACHGGRLCPHPLSDLRLGEPCVVARFHHLVQ